MRSFDWSSTPLGPKKLWPQSLRSALSICLGSGFPIAIYWGPQLAALYNDAWSAILGGKHPWGLGRRAAEVWPELWDTIGPMFAHVLSTGEATYSVDQLLPMRRHGYAEECYFNYTFSPIRGESGQVEGIFNAVIETTYRVLGERRTHLLRELGERLAAARSPAEVCAFAAAALGAGAADVPFSALYLVEAAARGARLAGVSGLVAGGPAAPASVTLVDDAAASWPLAKVWRSGQLEIVTGLPERFGITFPGGAWPEPASAALVAPVFTGTTDRPAGFLIIGVSPRRAVDEEYRQFAERAASHVATSIASTTAYETECRRAEALAALDREKTAFFSSISHEFRTPLTLILGPIEDALTSPERVLAGESLEAVHRNALRLLKLVNALLDFSRIEAGRAKASHEPTDLSRLTAELASAFRSAIERAGLAFEVSCPPLPQPVYVDRDMWEKILFNLLSNALKFTFAGAIRVALRPAGDYVELSVRDTGTGIPEEEMPRLFERFHRIQGARARTHEGSGSGLALTQELARLHGGSIRAESSLGTGTTFTVAIPFGAGHLKKERLEAAKEPGLQALGAAPFVAEALRWLPEVQREKPRARDSAPQKAEAELAPKSKDAPARVLVVDDNADMRDYLRRILEGRFQVQVASDGVAALFAAHRSRPDLVLTDVMMPNLDGFGLLHALRAEDAMKSIPVIMLSARAGDESRAEGLEAGADDYLVKPFSARELVARVALHLQLAELRHAAEREREKLYSLFEQAPVAIAVFRCPDFVYELANPRYRRMVGGRELIGWRVHDAFPELMKTQALDVYDRVYRTGEPVAVDSYRADLDRGRGVVEEAYWSYNMHPVRDESGAVVRLLHVAIDVTEQVLARKRLEEAAAEREVLIVRAEKARAEAEAANRSKDEFLAMLGHELRNPLAPIVTALHLLRLRAGTVGERERAVIERQVKHLASLVDDLLDISRITRGKIELRKERLELAEVVAKAIEMASPLLEQRRHHLEVKVPGHGLVVDGDRTRLAQVILNLLTNAAKYTDTEGRITVEASRDDSRRGEAVIRVLDNGIGIAPEMRTKIFDLFAQERQAIDRSQGGLGLGLAIAKSLIDLHGGTIDVYSEGKGRGSVFTVRLPAVAEPRAVAPSQDLAVPDKSAAAAPGPGKRRVLVVDDNQDAAVLLAESLRFLGHKTSIAHDGPNALRMAEEFLPDVVLLDIGLPVMDGYEVARRLRDHPALSRARLIALTGYGQESDRHRAQEAGFDMHIVKPLNMDRLAALLDERTRAAP